VYGLLRRLDASAVLHPEEMALLGSVPFLEILPPYEREQLARAAVWVDVQAGSVVIQQGDPGDRFYVIARGEFAVTVDGRPLPAPLVAGDSFGETALLWSVPRTATVACVTSGRLLALEAQDFLAAVTGHSDGHALAQEVSGGFVPET
jgi:CRP-like cAMP-binding protein